MAKMDDSWSSINEICTCLGVSNDTAYEWIDMHKMPPHSMGRLWELKKDEVGEWVKAERAIEHALRNKRRE